jgi:hypothetical protein
MSNNNSIDSSSCGVSAVSSQPIFPNTQNTVAVGGSVALIFSWITNSMLIPNDILNVTFPLNYITVLYYSGAIIINDDGENNPRIGKSPQEILLTIGSIYLANT